MLSLTIGTLPSFIAYFLNYLVGVVISRWMGPTVYGNIAAIFALTTAISGIFEFGLSNTALQVIPGYSVQKDFMRIRGIIINGMASILAITLGVFLFGAIVHLLFYPIFHVLTFVQITIAILIGVAMAFVRFFSALINSEKAFILSSFLSYLVSPIVLLLGLFVVRYFTHLQLERRSIVLLYAFSWLSALSFAIFFAKKIFSRLSFNSEVVFETKMWLAIGSTYTLSTITLLIANNVGVIALHYYFPQSPDAGIYAAIVNITSIMLIILSGSAKYFLPRLSGSYAQQDWEKLKSLLAIRLRFLGTIAIVFFCIILFAGRYLLKLFGEVYVNYHLLLIIAALVIITETLLSVSLNLAMIYGHNKRAAVSQLIMVSAIIVLTLVLVPFLSIYGVLIAYAVPKLGVLSFNALWIRKTYKIRILPVIKALKISA